MKSRMRVATLMICVPFLVLLISTPKVLSFAIGDRSLIDGMTGRDPFGWEAAFARIAIATVGLLISVFPFQKGKAWAWVALGLLLIIYVLPVFVLPILIPFPGWHVFWNGVVSPGLPRIVFLNLFLSASMLGGLILSVPWLTARDGQ